MVKIQSGSIGTRRMVSVSFSKWKRCSRSVSETCRKSVSPRPKYRTRSSVIVTPPLEFIRYILMVLSLRISMIFSLLPNMNDVISVSGSPKNVVVSFGSPGTISNVPSASRILTPRIVCEKSTCHAPKIASSIVSFGKVGVLSLHETKIDKVIVSPKNSIRFICKVFLLQR